MQKTLLFVFLNNYKLLILQLGITLQVNSIIVVVLDIVVLVALGNHA